jgi:hypothetical protein
MYTRRRMCWFRSIPISASHEHSSASVVLCVSENDFTLLSFNPLWCNSYLLWQLLCKSTLFLVIIDCGFLRWCAVQLFQKLSIRASNGPDKLMRIVKQPMTRYLPLGARRIGKYAQVNALVTIVYFTSKWDASNHWVLGLGAVTLLF